MSGESFMSDAVLANLKPTDYLSRSYINSVGDRVTLYVGYHGGGKDGGEIHSPKHCLPGSGWFEVKSEKRVIAAAGDNLNSVWTVYQKGDRKELFIYWFQVMGKTLDDEYSLKASEIINSALYRRRDAAFVRISVPFEMDESSASSKGEVFVREIYPQLKNYLPS
jgi:EpsI family protein